MNKQKILWERLAKENSRYYINSDFGRGISEKRFRQSGADAYKRFIEEDKLLKSRKVILDFGCGTGRITEFMAKDFKRVIGLDISGAMIDQGRERLKDLKNVDLLEIDGQYIPLPDDSIDIVFSYLVFQHIKTREMVEEAFAEIYRVLAHGGVFKVLLRSDKQRGVDHWWSGVEYNEESIRKVYEKTGFAMLKIENVDKHAYWLWLKKEMSNSDRARWEKGKASTLRFYKRKLPWKNKSFNRELYLPDYFAQMIGDKKEVSIADLGAGMFCTIGSLWKTTKVKVYPSDVLADEFIQILKEHNIKPLIPVMKEDMENLSYPDNFFDIVHCVNALDHTRNPLRALREMYRVCKPGGYVYLRHFINVGENEKYYGLHLWNIDIKGGGCVIWNPEKRFLLSDYFKGFISTKKTEHDYETEDMVVSILQKK